MKKYEFTKCPFCGMDLGLFRKIFVYNELYAYDCPYCKRKIKRRAVGNVGGLWGSVLLIILWWSVKTSKVDVLWFIAIPIMIYYTIKLIVSPLVSGEKIDS